MCCLNDRIISSTPETVVSNWLQYILALCSGPLSKFKLQTANSERKRSRLFYVYVLPSKMPWAVTFLPGIRYVRIRIPAGTKPYYFLSSSFPPSKREDVTLNEATTAFSHIDSDSFNIHYTRQYTILSYRQHRETKPQIQNVQYRSVGRNIFQPGNSRHKSLSTEPQVFKTHKYTATSVNFIRITPRNLQ
jgi:hypothetical protein